MSNREENVHDLPDSLNAGRLKMSSSLKQRLKRTSRAFSSPLRPSVGVPLNIKEGCSAQNSFSSPLISNIEVPLNIKSCASIQNSANLSDIEPFLENDIDACNDQKQIEQIHYHLKAKILANEEKIRKLRLVEHYHSKNKPDDLVCLIQKWLTASQEATRMLFEKLPENKADFSCFLKILNIDYSVIKYDPDSDTFY